MLKFQSFLSGSSGNCTFVTDDRTCLLVDCGANGKYITECLRRIGVAPQALAGIFITHEHRDHIAGAGVMSRKYDVPIFATEKTWAAIGTGLGTVREQNQRLTEPELTLGSLTVRSFPIPHDAADPVGYSVLSEHEKFTVATDLGHITDTLKENLKGSVSAIVEANHDIEMLKNGPYPVPLQKRILGDKGHLSNGLCGRLCAFLAKTGTRALWLGHLSPENNRPGLAYETVAAVLREENAADGSLSLNVLPRYWLVPQRPAKVGERLI